METPAEAVVSDPARERMATQLSELAQLLERHSGSDGIHPTIVPGVAIHRLSTTVGEPDHLIHEPAMCLIVQGEKRIVLNDEVYVYDASRFLIVSVDVPIIGLVTRATAERPYLAFRMNLDPGEIAALILQSAMAPASDRGVMRALMLTKTSSEMLDAVIRLTKLLCTPEDIEALGPLAKREILYRLLKSEQGQLLRQIAEADGRCRRISQAIFWIRQHFDKPIRVEELSRLVHMSASSFHHHFKAITSMSPLKYQKQIRLQEARRLMLLQGVDAATAGHRVGYESPSQFGREYRKQFGESPMRDMRRLLRQTSGQQVPKPRE